MQEQMTKVAMEGAAHGAGPIALEVIVFLVAAVASALAVQRLKWSPVVGYLIAGAIIGPFGIGLVGDIEEVRTLAEFGVVFLMFTIGLELSLDRLKAMRRFVFGLGALQVALSTIPIAGIALAFGLGRQAALVVGLALALSSTAVVVRMLMEQEALSTRVGQRAFGVLLFQDIAVVPILLLVSLLGDEAPSLSMAALLAVAEAALAIGAVIVVGRYVARPVFREVSAAKNPELFAATTLLLVLTAAWLMHHVGLSMALGAFLAGLLLAETEYATQVELDIEPYRGLLLGLFFISVGMAVDIRVVLASFHWIALALIALLAVKASILFVLGRLFDLKDGRALRLGLLLAQAGEFGFVVFAAAFGYGILDAPTVQILTVVVGLSVALTPALSAAGVRLERALVGRGLMRSDDLEETAGELEGHVIIAGFGRVGQTLATLLSQQKINFVALDLNPEGIAAAARRGLPVFYGNSSSHEVLKAAGIKRASVLAITLDTPSAASKAVQAARAANPDLAIVVRARDHAHGHEMEEMGATASVPETLEASLQLGGQVLRSVGLSHTTADDLIESLRINDYAAIRDLSAPPRR